MFFFFCSIRLSCGGGGGGGREEQGVSLCVIMTNTEIFHIFLIISQLKSEKIWTIWKKDKLNSEKI
jgi:hypothetical protein